METVLILAGIGFLLLVAEMFLPGGVLGVLGGLLLVAALIAGYVHFGPFGGTIVLCAILVLGLVGFCIAMAAFPQTKLGRRMTLSQPADDHDGLAVARPSVGSEGVAATPLRPAGKAVFDGRRLDVQAAGEFVEAGESVSVTAADGAHITVRKKA